MSEPGVDPRPPAGPGPLVRLGASAVAAVSVLAGRALIAMGVLRPPEGWRRTVGILLRSESTRFGLSAFGLRIPPGDDGTPDAYDRLAHHLRSFLAGEPDAHFALEWRTPVTLRRRIAWIDVVRLRFGSAGTLEAVAPCLAPDGPAPPPAAEQHQVHQAVVEGYNLTVRLPERQRPAALLKHVLSRAEATGAQSYARRLLAACCLSVESMDMSDPTRRFCPPAFETRRTLGFGYQSWVARVGRDASVTDLWVSAHHVGLDGVPLQDLLRRLEDAWGTAEDVSFPAALGGQAFAGPRPCHVAGERPIEHVTMFVDLGPVLALRRDLNASYGSAVGGAITLGTILAWLLSQDAEFAGVRIASTVDVAASNGYERDVDVVSLRPADFVTGSGPWDGFVAFAREFNRLVAACRTRTSPVRAGMQAAGLIPAWAHAAVVASNPAALDETFGTLCVTIVRDARVFVSPMTDLGLWQGFFAIGSANLPSTSGSAVTSVSIKGDAGRIAHYPAILQRVVERAERLRQHGVATTC